jgi:hypothetical protein
VGGFEVHEGEDIGGLVSPTPTDPSLSAPMPGYPEDSGVNPESVMMNESSEGGNVDAPNNAADAANRLGVNLDDIAVNNSVARTKIDLSSTLDPKRY